MAPLPTDRWARGGEQDLPWKTCKLSLSSGTVSGPCASATFPRRGSTEYSVLRRKEHLRGLREVVASIGLALSLLRTRRSTSTKASAGGLVVGRVRCGYRGPTRDERAGKSNPPLLAPCFRRVSWKVLVPECSAVPGPESGGGGRNPPSPGSNFGRGANPPTRVSRLFCRGPSSCCLLLTAAQRNAGSVCASTQYEFLGR